MGNNGIYCFMGCIEMKQKITEFGTWAENNYMVLVYAAGALVLPLLFLLALSLLNGYRDWETDRKSTRLNSSHSAKSRMPSSA